MSQFPYSGICALPNSSARSEQCGAFPGAGVRHGAARCDCFLSGRHARVAAEAVWTNLPHEDTGEREGGRGRETDRETDRERDRETERGTVVGVQPPAATPSLNLPYPFPSAGRRPSGIAEPHGLPTRSLYGIEAHKVEQSSGTTGNTYWGTYWGRGRKAPI